jgi:hypothetical protein
MFTQIMEWKFETKIMGKCKYIKIIRIIFTIIIIKQ